MIYEQEHSIFDKNSLYRKFSTIDTSFKTTNGKIAAIISDAEIEELVDESTTMNSKLNSTISDVDSIKTQLSDIHTTIANDGTVQDMLSRITTVETTAGEAHTKASSAYAAVQPGGALESRVTAAEQDIDANTGQIALRVTRTDLEKAFMSGNLSSFFAHDINDMYDASTNPIGYWHFKSIVDGCTFTNVDDGWVHVVLDNSAGTATIRNDFYVRSNSNILPGEDYTFLFEFKNRISYADGTGDNYVVQTTKTQFWGNAIKKNLEGRGGTSTTSLGYIPTDGTIYRKRFVKTSEAADSSNRTDNPTTLVRITFRATAGQKISFDFRGSMYKGEYTGPYLPYVMYDSDYKRMSSAQLQILENEISTKVSTSDYNGNMIVSKIIQNAENVNVLAQNINLQGQLTISAFDTSTKKLVSDMQAYTTELRLNQDDIDSRGAVNQSYTWTVNESTANAVVGNTAMIRVYNTTKGAYTWILGEITRVVSNTQITCKSLGILEKGSQGPEGPEGPEGIQGPAGADGEPGVKGDKGAQGISIVSTQMQYCLSTASSGNDPGSVTWTDAPPAYVSGRYYWERAKTTLNDPSKSGSAATSYAYSTAVLSRGLNTAISNAKTAQEAADAVDAIIRDWASANDTTLIDGAKIYTGTVTTDKLAANAVTAAKIASEAIMANHLRADTLVGKELYVTDTSGRTGWTTTIYYRNSASSTMNDRIANRDSATWYTTIPAYQSGYPYLWAYAKIGDYKSIPVCVARRSSATSYTWYHNVNVSEGRIWSAMNDCYIMFDSVSNNNKPERLAMMSSEGEVSVGKYNAGDTLSSGDASVNIWGKKKVHVQSNTEVSVSSMNDVSIVVGDGKALHIYGNVIIHRGSISYVNGNELSS